MTTVLIVCKICKKQVVGRQKSWEQHCAGRKHVSLLPKQLFVKGSFDIEKIDDVHGYFEKFGKISKNDVVVEQDSVTIEYIFEDKKAYTNIIHTHHQIFNKPLEISWIKPGPVETTQLPQPLPVLKLTRRSKKGKKANKGTIAPEGNNIETKNCSSQGESEAEASGLVAEAAPTQEGNKKKMASESPEELRSSIINSIKEGKTFAEQINILQSKLQANQPEVEKNRKIVYNDLTAALSSMFPDHQIHFFGSSITGLDFQSSDLDVYIGNVKQWSKPEVLTLKKIRMLIFKCKKFCDVLLISGATVPIIKCIHTRTQMCCDLNIRNKLSVCNSELIKYYLTIDEKLKPLMIAIKYWADCCGLKKVNFFSGYALYLMVIFYLQQEPYNLPTVADLQKNCPEDVEDGWNCAFLPADHVDPKLGEVNIVELMTGFFRFYSSFDYISLVICPYYGIPLEKTRFLKPCDLPACFKDFAEIRPLNMNSGICIQDPFELSRNVSASVPLQCAGKLMALCSQALELMLQPETNLLHQLLIKCSRNPLNEYSFEIQRTQSEDDNGNKKWIETVKYLTLKTFKEIMICQISKVPATGDYSNFVKGAVDHVIYDCAGLNNVWDNRMNLTKNMLTQLPPKTNELNREVAVSTCIMKYFPQTLITKMVVGLFFKQNPCRVQIVPRTRVNGKRKHFLHISHFLRVKLPKWLETIDDIWNVHRSVPAAVVEKKPDTAVLENSEVKMIKNENSPKTQTDSEVPVIESEKDQAVVDVKTKEEPTNGDNCKAEEEGELLDDDDDDDDEEDEEEDVPPDFFDDFSNQDFMDGLDIVDAWDEESGKPTEGGATEMSKEERNVEDKGEKKHHSPIRFSSRGKYHTNSSEKRSKRRSRSRSPVRRRKRSSSYGRRPRSRSRSRDKIRRDPEKTKRDINRDKIKCAKDKEQKLVNDKLKIVETGLVPPGTEMDVDINSIIKTQSTGSSAERALRDSKSDRKYIKKSGSREVRKFARYSRSPPVYRSRNRERIESSYRQRRRPSSVDSNASERELWIRSSRKRSRSRDSPSRSKQKKYEEKKKKTFLEEIRDKLNEVRPVPVVQYAHPIMQFPNNPAPIPAPVPAPNQFFPQPQNNPGMQQYDQRFFIGDAYQVGSSNLVLNQSQTQNVDFNMVGNAGNVVPIQMTQVPQIPIQTPKLPTATVSPKLPVRHENTVKPVEQKNNQATDDIDKLFADKKISLSDFLTITAKCEVQTSSPEHLQKKIKVISRCQDAIKAMSDDRKFTGRLSVKATPELKNRSEVKYQSPLRRIPIVRFQFTSPAKALEETDTFAAALDKILKKIGILQDTIEIEDVSEYVPTKTSSSFADEDTAALTLKASLLGAAKRTDTVTCDECKKRKLKVFSDVGSQCADAKETCSIGIQVSDEDLAPSKGLLKNESIAYLTPAQLLGKEKETPSTPTSDKNENVVATESVSETKKEKPQSNSRGRGGFRKSLRDRVFNFDADEFEFFDRARPGFEDPREGFSHRFGSGMPPSRFVRHFDGQPGMVRMNQLREDDGSLFTDFNQPYRGRNLNRFGPRY